MKFKNRKEEAMARFAAKEAERANEAAWKQQLQIMKEMKTPLLHPDHKLPSTRRELVGAGLMTGLSYAVVPGILSAITQKAYGIDAEKCKADANAGDAAAAPAGYLHIELSGGASLAGNMVFGKQSAGAPIEYLADYSTLGFGNDIKPGTVEPNTTFGAPFHPESRILQGMLSVMSAEAAAKTRAAGGAGTSGDDSRNNPLNPIQLAVKTRSNGALTTMAIQADGRNSGGRTAPLDLGDDPSIAKAIVSDEASLANLVDPGLIAERLSVDAAVKISEAAGKLSESKLARFNAQDLPTQVQELVACGYLGSKDLLTEFTADRLAPSSDAMITGAPYGALTLNQINADENQQRSIIMSKLLTDNLASGGTIEMGGYDYHGRGRQAQNDRDQEVGVVIGLALETAHRKGQPLFIAITSDGSTAAQQGGTGHVAHRADSGARGSCLMFAIGAAAAPDMIQNQIGKFNDQGAVDTSYLVTSNSPNLQALMIAYNYAAFSGNMAAFDTQVASAGGTNPFNEKEYLAFAPKA
ncbi:hypothetical protein [Pseudobacteriovorax antillogorgiicola]|uniref:General secretion pathway protein GspF n=1 Tax=Pseudobacteriovorax antillogorgiicola TaxID=1513793 RepID=A0A1Y6BV62_9BACT|nr:hypothetical protein [Pseudobacteriovorax antillogorgiicola]TCS52408.1 hypothetical protein EDD56_109153 [Pseudobacteriovorax antillogorgiicola]SMF28903.1 hypothetical protein SAMN06296036_10960 [Pseudobacteriovorax antillogorgiicola]